jgi:hypothetical protein
MYAGKNATHFYLRSFAPRRPCIKIVVVQRRDKLRWLGKVQRGAKLHV